MYTRCIGQFARSTEQMFRNRAVAINCCQVLYSSSYENPAPGYTTPLTIIVRVSRAAHPNVAAESPANGHFRERTSQQAGEFLLR